HGGVAHNEQSPTARYKHSRYLGDGGVHVGDVAPQHLGLPVWKTIKVAHALEALGYHCLGHVGAGGYLGADIRSAQFAKMTQPVPHPDERELVAAKVVDRVEVGR